MSPIKRQIDGDLMHYDLVTVEIDREEQNTAITLNGPEQNVPADTDALTDLGAEYWMLKLCREVEDTILHLRVNEPEIGTLILKTLVTAQRCWRMMPLLPPIATIGLPARYRSIGSG